MHIICAPLLLLGPFPFNEDQEEDVPTSPDSPAVKVGQVHVRNEVVCPQGFVCPAVSDFVNRVSVRGPPGNILVKESIF